MVSYAAEDEDEDVDGWRRFLDDARLFDRCGVDRVVISDHVVFGERLDEYGRPEIGGQAGGTQPTGPDGEWLEPLTTLSYLAAVTEHVRLGTNILIAALRRPVVLAKSTATLDVLSGGRLDVGVGVGWQREEYEAAGLAFEGRGRLLDHSLEVCRTLWTEQRAQYRAAELTFDRIHLMPKPVQRGGIPIWVSGTVNPRVVRRVARFGSGWIPWGDAAADVVTGIARMREGLAALGRDPEGLQVVGSVKIARRDDGVPDAGRTMAAVPRLLDAGVTDVRLRLTVPEEREVAEDLVRSLVGEFRTVTGRAGVP